MSLPRPQQHSLLSLNSLQLFPERPMNSLVSAFHRYVFKSSIFWWSVLLGNGLRFHLSKFRSSCSSGWCSANSSCSSSSSWPCLRITLWGWWKEGQEKKPSPHMFSTAELCSPPIFSFQITAEKKMACLPAPSMTDDINCQRVLCILMNIALLVLSPVSANYKPAGDLCGTRWESWPPLSGPSCLEQQLQTAELEGHSDSQMLLTDSQHPLDRTHRSQRDRRDTRHFTCESLSFKIICCWMFKMLFVRFKSMELTCLNCAVS